MEAGKVTFDSFTFLLQSEDYLYEAHAGECHRAATVDIISTLECNEKKTYKTTLSFFCAYSLSAENWTLESTVRKKKFVTMRPLKRTWQKLRIPFEFD